MVGHRGASGYLPEHTLESYKLAIEQGADYIEPDLVSTKDGILIARHENEISGTTDVAEKYPTRKRTKMIDGVSVTGWFTEDFTIDEIRNLRAKERLPFRNQNNNGKYKIPTFAEILAFVNSYRIQQGKIIGVMPELKHPTYFDSIKLNMILPFIHQVKENNFNRADAPMIVQCFELGTLKELKDRIAIRLFFLFDDKNKTPYDNVAAKVKGTYGDLLTPSGLYELSKVVYGVGPEKSMLVDDKGKDNGTVALIHKAGLKVIPYTFRKEAQFVSTFAKDDFNKELATFFSLGVDGLFSDFPDLAVAARKSIVKK